MKNHIHRLLKWGFISVHARKIYTSGKGNSLVIPDSGTYVSYCDMFTFNHFNKRKSIFLLEGAFVITMQARPIIKPLRKKKWLLRAIFYLLAGGGWRGKSERMLPGWLEQLQLFSRYSSAVISSFTFVDRSSEARRRNFIRFPTDVSVNTGSLSVEIYNKILKCKTSHMAVRS